MYRIYLKTSEVISLYMIVSLPAALILVRLWFNNVMPNLFRHLNRRNDMRKWILISGLFLNLIFINKSQATECFHGYLQNCYEWNPGVKDNCGQGCTYTYDAASRTLFVKAEGDNATISAGAFMPYQYQTDTSKKTFPSADGDVLVDNVEIDGIFNIGDYAFLGLGANIQGKNGQLITTHIDREVFLSNTLSGDIVIDDLSNMANLFNRAQLSENVTIYCKEKSTEQCRDYIVNSCREEEEDCKEYVSGLLSNDSLFSRMPSHCAVPSSSSGCSRCDNGFALSGNGCVCPSNHRLNGKNCNRLIYTIDEASAVAGEKNRVSIKYR